MNFALRRRLREALHFLDVSYYQQYMFLALGDSRREAIEALELKPGTKLLEVGVGHASALEHYPREVHLTGVDYSAALIEEAKKRAQELNFSNAHFYVMNAQALRPLESNSFDTVLSNSLLSVVPQPRKAFAEMVRLCRPGGRIVITSHFMHAQGWQHVVDSSFSGLSKKLLGYQTKLPPEIITECTEVEILRRKEYPLPHTPYYSMCTLFALQKK